MKVADDEDIDLNALRDVLYDFDELKKERDALMNAAGASSGMSVDQVIFAIKRVTSDDYIAERLAHYVVPLEIERDKLRAHNAALKSACDAYCDTIKRLAPNGVLI